MIGIDVVIGVGLPQPGVLGIVDAGLVPGIALQMADAPGVAHGIAGRGGLGVETVVDDSQAIVAGGFVFASGQLPIDPATGEFAEGGIKEQTRQSLTNVTHVLAEAGIDLSHVVKTTVFLSDMANFAAMNEVYATFFSEPYPARSAVAVKTLPKNALVEVEVVAAL